MGWYVDEQYVWSDYRDELEEDGFDFHTNHQPTYTHLKMTVPVINSRNGTKIQCEAYSPGNPAYSNIAWLWIIGEWRDTCVMSLCCSLFIISPSTAS